MKDYLKTLNEISSLAKEEYDYCTSKIAFLKKDLTDYQNTLLKIDLENSYINSKEIIKPIENIKKELKKLLQKGFEELEDSFLEKRENLSSFTVTLFGRTKAGKSTIREALTNGDGSSIGKGAQRTTRDIKIYKWNNLTLIDTPGFEAFAGEEDEKIAFSQINKTDLILFLITSDNIEESEFQKLALFRKENKPVIILLNVLFDIYHPIKRKQFLKNPKKYVSHEAIKGHIKRLNFLAKKYFDINNIPIIPIHALAAFESTKTEDSKEKRKLYEASNFGYFTKYMINEIKTTGKYKRILTFRDSYIFNLENNIKNIYTDTANTLRPVVKTLKNKQYELRNWFDRFISEKNKEIEIEIENVFAPLFSKIDSFVDENIENKEFGNLWEKEVQVYANKENINKIAENITEEMNDYLNNFFKEFEYDLNLNFQHIKNSVSHKEKENLGKVLRWGSALASVGSGIIIAAIEAGALANAWNPVGWGLGAVAFIIGVWSLIRGRDSERFNKEKAKTKEKLRNSLEKMKIKNKKALKAWFYKEITRGLKKKIKQDLYNQVKEFDNLLKNTYSIIDKVDENINKENISLFEKMLSIYYNQPQSTKIYNIGRLQGTLSKCVVLGSLFYNNEDKKVFSKILGERIDEVQYSENRDILLQSLLGVSLKKIENVKNKIIVYVAKEDIKKAFGKHRANLITAQKIIKKQIFIKEKNERV